MNFMKFILLIPIVSNLIFINYDNKNLNDQSFKEKEVINYKECNYLEVLPFKYNFADYRKQNEFNFNLPLRKRTMTTIYYRVYLKNENSKELIYEGQNLVGDTKQSEEFKISVKINRNKILYDSTLDFNFSTIKSFLANKYDFSVPISNTDNYLIKDQTAKILISTMFENKVMSLNYEYLTVTGIEKENYIDYYLRFNVKNIGIKYQTQRSQLIYTKATLVLKNDGKLFSKAFVTKRNRVTIPLSYEALSNNNVINFTLNKRYYVDSNTFIMSKNQTDFENYITSDDYVYFPSSQYEKCKTTSALLSINDFGKSHSNVYFEFNIYFHDKTIFDLYDVVGSYTNERYDSKMEEVKIW